MSAARARSRSLVAQSSSSGASALDRCNTNRSTSTCFLPFVSRPRPHLISSAFIFWSDSLRHFISRTFSCLDSDSSARAFVRMPPPHWFMFARHLLFPSARAHVHLPRCHQSYWFYRHPLSHRYLTDATLIVPQAPSFYRLCRDRTCTVQLSSSEPTYCVILAIKTDLSWEIVFFRASRSVFSRSACSRSVCSRSVFSRTSRTSRSPSLTQPSLARSAFSCVYWSAFSRFNPSLARSAFSRASRSPSLTQPSLARSAFSRASRSAFSRSAFSRASRSAFFRSAFSLSAFSLGLLSCLSFSLLSLGLLSCLWLNLLSRISLRVCHPVNAYNAYV